MERVFDFSGHCVKLNGRPLSKFEVAYEIEHIAPVHSSYSLTTLLWDVLTYRELVSKLKEVLEVYL